MFDNAFSRGKEFEFTIGRGMVIKGWDLGIPLLKEGGKATLIIPSEFGLWRSWSRCKYSRRFNASLLC
jgi:FKBP-type peptidyl-prolyl cis-trans isomerase